MLNAASPGCVVFGGGALGSAVARLAHASGEAVVVASRNPGSHPGWWRRCGLDADSRVAWLPRGVHVVVAVGPAPHEAWTSISPVAKIFYRLTHYSPQSLVVAVPAGRLGEVAEVVALAAAARDAGASVVRVGPLFGVGDGYLSRQVMVLRGGGTVLCPKVGPTRILCADDAARVVLRARGAANDLTISGFERVSADDATNVLVGRFGGQVRTPMLGDGLHRNARARLSAWSDLPDSWDEDSFGPRLSLADWVARLPGPRRRAGEPSHGAPAG